MMKNLLLLAGFVLLASEASGIERLTINGEDVDAISLIVGESCTVEVVSSSSTSYIRRLYAQNINSDDLELIEIKTEAGSGASATIIPETEYRLQAGGIGVGAGTHFVFQYTAADVGQKIVGLRYLLTPDVIDSIVINVASIPAGGVFTYQGRLIDGGSPANGTYDFQFKLFNTVTSGDQVGSTNHRDDVLVNDGCFSVRLNFGVEVFTGEQRWLEVGVRLGALADPDPYVTLPQRQPITACPYAIQTRGIFVDNNLNVGIGTTRPAGKLHVESPSTYGDIIFLDAGGGQNDLSIDPDSLYSGDIHRIYLVEVTYSSGDPDKFRWSDDNGVSWSTDQLEMTTGWYDLSHGVRVKWDSTDGHFDGSGSAGDVWVWAALCRHENSLVVTDGKVGIGTSSPTWELDVANPTPGEGAESGVTADDSGGAMAAYSSTLPAPFDHYAGRVSLFSNATTMGLDLRADGDDGDIRLYTGGFAPSNERMRVTSHGSIGVGTTTPIGKLAVDNYGESGISINSYRNDGLGRWQEGLFFTNNSNGMGPWTQAAIWADGVSGFNGELVFGVDGDGTNSLAVQEVMRINKSGNLGVGTKTPETRLDVSGNARISGKLGIGTVDPAAKLDVIGDLRVTGAYKGNIGPNNGAPFPRPAYDSGWVAISQGQDLTLIHGVGGSSSDYFVDLSLKSPQGVTHNEGHGGVYTGSTSFLGAHWWGLSNNQIKVNRWSGDTLVGQVRIRIWVYN